jgi:hypothetical protein
MSHTFSRYQRPFDAAHHPALDPEVKRAIVASWVSDRHAVEHHSAMHQPSAIKGPVSVDDPFAALRSIDGPNSQLTLQ